MPWPTRHRQRQRRGSRFCSRRLLLRSITHQATNTSAIRTVAAANAYQLAAVAETMVGAAAGGMALDYVEGYCYAE
jgi:hypothetical protein